MTHSAAADVARGKLRIAEVAWFLDPRKNPLMVRTLSKSELEYALCNFAGLSEALPRLLSLAAHTCSPNDRVQGELLLNLAEEQGRVECFPGLEGVSHYEILVQELRSAGFEPCNDGPPGPTRELVTELQILVCDNLETAFGAILALEAMAVPEITIFRTAVERYAAEESTKLPPLLIQFFDAHTTGFEVAHAERLFQLYEAVSSSPERGAQVGRGFDKTIQAMSTWWSRLCT